MMIYQFHRFKKYGLLILAFIASTALSAQTLQFPPVDTLPALDTLPDETLVELAVRLATQSGAVSDVFQFELTRTTVAREELEQKLSEAKADSTVTADDRKSLQQEIKTAKVAEKAAKKQADKARKAYEFAERVTGMPAREQRQNLPIARKKMIDLLPAPEPPAEAPLAEVIGVVGVAEPTDLAAPPVLQADTLAADTLGADSLAEKPRTPKNKKDKTTVPAGPKFKSYNPAEDVTLNPPARPCQLVADTRDEFSGERRREMGREELFRYTNPSLKPYFTDFEHIVCEAALSSTNNNYILHLTFTIRDVNARRAFGSLPRNGVAILKLLDGDTYTLYNLRADEGLADKDNKVFTYRGQYQVEPGMLKKLQKTLLDKVRIAWGTGYEDYDVQNVDLLARQLSCLMKN